MSGVARMGDTSDHGLGAINDGGVFANVFVNGQPIAIGSEANIGGANTDALYKPPTSSSPCVHCNGLVGTQPGPLTGSPSVFAGPNATPVHRLGDRRGCGAETNTASTNVFANDPGSVIAQGATVQDPIEGPAGPANFSYPISEVIMFVGSNMMYTRDTPWNDIQSIEDLTEYGTILSPQLTANPGQGYLDIDLADRGPFSENDTTNSEVVLGGLVVKGFPSYGVLNPNEVGVIQRTPIQNNESFQFKEFTLANGEKRYEFLNKPTNLSVSNESGQASLQLTLVVISSEAILPFLFNSIITS